MSRASPKPLPAIGHKKTARMRGFFMIWWAHTDSNRGPKDYEFANDTATLGFIGLHEETVQYAKAQGNQYVSER